MKLQQKLKNEKYQAEQAIKYRGYAHPQNPYYFGQITACTFVLNHNITTEDKFKNPDRKFLRGWNSIIEMVLMHQEDAYN